MGHDGDSRQRLHLLHLFGQTRSSMEILSGFRVGGLVHVETLLFQYLSGSDLPVRTNLEMVRVMKALNGSINSDVDVFDTDRYKNMEVGAVSTF